MGWIEKIKKYIGITTLVMGGATVVYYLVIGLADGKLESHEVDKIVDSVKSLQE